MNGDMIRIPSTTVTVQDRAGTIDTIPSVLQQTIQSQEPSSGSVLVDSINAVGKYVVGGILAQKVTTTQYPYGAYGYQYTPYTNLQPMGLSMGTILFFILAAALIYLIATRKK